MSTVPLYRLVMGADFLQLPASLQHFHALQGHHLLEGRVRVLAPASAAARLLARCIGAPLRAAEGAIRFELTAHGATETWIRHFPHRTMRSRLTLAGRGVAERMGAAQLLFALEACPQGLVMRLVGLRFMGVPCPRWLLPAVIAEETATAGRLHFHVHAALPAVGRVAGYEGYLRLPDKEAA